MRTWQQPCDDHLGQIRHLVASIHDLLDPGLGGLHDVCQQVLLHLLPAVVGEVTHVDCQPGGGLL